MHHLGPIFPHLLRLGVGARQWAMGRLEAQPAAGVAAAGTVELAVFVERRALRLEVARRAPVHVVEARRGDLGVLLELGEAAQLPGVDARCQLGREEGRLASRVHEVGLLTGQDLNLT